jgi:probable HAF family extracellular repeat protein
MRGSVLLLAVCAAACGRYTAEATVTVAVSGPGAVRGSRLEGDCRGTCWFSVARETAVHLEPVVDGQASFAGWSGACSGTGSCDLKPGVDVSVAATFMPAPAAQLRRLQVSLNGGGAVRSDPAGIDCPTTCAADFPDGATVRLLAEPTVGWDFTSFGGACSGLSCAVTLWNDVSAWATFVQRPVTLSVEVSGSGSVLSYPAGIDCPRICSAAFMPGTELALKPSAGSGFNFSGFSGACGGATCALRLSGDEQVAAAFTAIPMFTVTVVTGGSGGGRVTSSPRGIDCPGTCGASFFEGAPVTLSATPDVLSKFARFSGSCSGAACSLALKADAAVAAEFEQRRYVAMELGTPAGGWWTQLAAISPHGTRITGRWGGYSWGMFLWDGTMRSIGSGDGHPAAVNDSGVVVGNHVSSSGHAQAFRLEADRSTELGTLGGPSSSATAINRQGVVAGWASRTDGVVRAAYWTSKGPVDLGSLGGPWNACSYAWGINSDGLIVGQSCTDDWGTVPVRFRGPGEIDDLGTLGGSWGAARAVNDAGMIVGNSSLANGASHGFVYADGKMTDAGSLPGMRYSELTAVNGAGIAVGTSYDNGYRGVVYGAGKMVDLNALVERTPYTITNASGIDEAGNIVVQGEDRGALRVLLLRPR